MNNDLIQNSKELEKLLKMPITKVIEHDDRYPEKKYKLYYQSFEWGILKKKEIEIIISTGQYHSYRKKLGGEWYKYINKYIQIKNLILMKPTLQEYSDCILGAGADFSVYIIRDNEKLLQVWLEYIDGEWIISDIIDVPS